MLVLRITASVTAGLCVLVALLAFFLSKAGASGSLGVNFVAGIRLPSTMRSPEAWKVGHQAALMPSKVMLIASFVNAGVLLVCWRSLTGTIVSQGIGFVVLLLVIIWPTVNASKAANTVSCSCA